MNVLILGADGQLGQSLCDTAPSNCHLLPTDIDAINIGDTDKLLRAFANFNPEVIINAAACLATIIQKISAGLLEKMLVMSLVGKLARLPADL